MLETAMLLVVVVVLVLHVERRVVAPARRLEVDPNATLAAGVGLVEIAHRDEVALRAGHRGIQRCVRCQREVRCQSLVVRLEVIQQSYRLACALVHACRLRLACALVHAPMAPYSV